MRWLVEVSSLGKADTKKSCVEAESWQRALEEARSQRGEDGPMSGFSIELLEEGYRAVDPLARVRFVVKRAPDDTPISTDAVMQAPVGESSADVTTPKLAPAPSSSAASLAAANVNVVNVVEESPRLPGRSSPPSASAAPAAAKMQGPTMTFSALATTPADDHEAVDPAAPPAVGSSIPGLPAVKLLTSREEDPGDASPLTYREYAFAMPDGTTEEAAADVLRAQLRYVEAQIATAKAGKLVNLAVFDIEFSGKPPRLPLATLTWKDWKGDPLVSFPRRDAGLSKAPLLPSNAPPEPMNAPPAMLGEGENGGPTVAMATTTGAISEPPAQPLTTPIAKMTSSAPPAAKSEDSPRPMTAPIPPAQADAALEIIPPQEAAAQHAHAQELQPSQEPPSFPSSKSARHSLIPAVPKEPTVSEAPKSERKSEPPASGMVRTPSGRFVRGRVSGDELITALFESMHDLHFLRDALDGGQFCLTLATEVLPARAALIHFFDIEKREWVVACTRGKDTHQLLTMRAPESDEFLREAARKRRALVVPNASSATSDRYRQLSGARSLIAAPIMQAGRALGALEIINPLDGMPFTEDEGNAMTYIAEQFAEYLGSRGIVLDRERIQSAGAH